VREAFLRQVDRRDLVACLVVQDVMLESFAASLYGAVAAAAPPALASVFRAISEEEKEHLDDSVSALQDALQADRDAFEAKVHGLHEEVMTALAEMIAREDPGPHCGLCHGTCVKPSLPKVGLQPAPLRGQALSVYLSTLDRIGVRGERSLAWVADLPL
jgi:fatty aldehyde decarbonylase